MGGDEKRNAGKDATGEGVCVCFLSFFVHQERERWRDTPVCQCTRNGGLRYECLSSLLHSFLPPPLPLDAMHSMLTLDTVVCTRYQAKAKWTL